MKPYSAYSCFLLDRDCEVFEVLRPYADQVYDNFAELTVPDNALVVIGRVQTLYNSARLRDLFNTHRATFIFCNASEGSDTIRWHLESMHVGDLAVRGKLPVITGGELPSNYANLPFQEFLTRIFSNRTNQCARLYTDRIFSKEPRPYKFLFLNGRARPHRKFLMEELAYRGVLNQGLWSCLEGIAMHGLGLSCWHDNQDLMTVAREIHYLPAKYEIAQHRSRLNNTPPDGNTFAKYYLFNGTWSDGELTPEAYWDSFFSLVTETVFDQKESFCTEKIWKPILIGHPWIAATNPGFYQSLHNMGFKTFAPVIDESFDRIEDTQKRFERIADVVTDLCQQDLDKFLVAVEDICRYNQEHIFELAPKYIKEFPAKFFEFAEKHKRN